MINKFIPHSVLVASAFLCSPAAAKTLEISCTCQGYARTAGAETMANNYVEDAHRGAVYFCETGTKHETVAAAGGTFCTPEACPSGTMDLGIYIRDCQGIRKSRYTPGTSTSDNFAPAEGGCNYDKSSPDPALRFVSCDLECNRVRQCATATR